MTAKVSKKNSFSTLSYQVLWLGSGIRPPRTIPLGPKFAEQVAALSKEGYEEYARTKQGDSDVLVMIKKDDELIHEIITCVYSDNNCVGVLVKGDINPEDLGAIVDMMGD